MKMLSANSRQWSGRRAAGSARIRSVEQLYLATCLCLCSEDFKIVELKR